MLTAQNPCMADYCSTVLPDIAMRGETFAMMSTQRRYSGRTLLAGDSDCAEIITGGRGFANALE